VIHRLGGFSRNLRKEVTSKSKYYFLDNGVRNGIIRRYNGLDTRDDIGALWENFIVTERLKKLTYHRFFGNRYFWRTYDGSELDLIEEEDGTLEAYEIKWSISKKLRVPKIWQKNYPNAKIELITPENYLDFIV